MDDEFAFGIIVGVILLMAGLLALWAYFFVEPEPPRNHIYYCWNWDIGASLPCKYRKNDPVDVSSQPRSIG